MAALIALAASGVIAAGIVAGIIGVVSVAIRREERNRTLGSRPTGYVTWEPGLLRRCSGHHRARRAAAACA